MVERERGGLLVLTAESVLLAEQVLDGCPARTIGVASGARRREVGREHQMGNAHHAHTGIPLRVSVGGQLFEMRAVPRRRGGGVVSAQSGLLGKLPCCRRRQILIAPDEATRQRPSALERRLAAPYHQCAERMTTHGEHDQVDGHSEGRKGRRVVGRHAVIIVVCLTINTPFATCGTCFFTPPPHPCAHPFHTLDRRSSADPPPWRGRVC